MGLIGAREGVMTTMGLQEPKPPMCLVCGERRDGLYTVNAYGQIVCPVCASPKHWEILAGWVSEEEPPTEDGG